MDILLPLNSGEPRIRSPYLTGFFGFREAYPLSLPRKIVACRVSGLGHPYEEQAATIRKIGVNPGPPFLNECGLY